MSQKIIAGKASYKIHRTRWGKQYITVLLDYSFPQEEKCYDFIICVFRNYAFKEYQYGLMLKEDKTTISSLSEQEAIKCLSDIEKAKQTAVNIWMNRFR